MSGLKKDYLAKCLKLILPLPAFYYLACSAKLPSCLYIYYFLDPQVVKIPGVITVNKTLLKSSTV